MEHTTDQPTEGTGNHRAPGAPETTGTVESRGDAGAAAPRGVGARASILAGLTRQSVGAASTAISITTVSVEKISL